MLDRAFLICVKSPHRTRSMCVVELNRFPYEPLDVGSLSQDLTSLSKIRVSLPWLTGSFFFQMLGLAEMIQRAIGN